VRDFSLVKQDGHHLLHTEGALIQAMRGHSKNRQCPADNGTLDYEDYCCGCYHVIHYESYLVP
jgi:hypothetical protein